MNKIFIYAVVHKYLSFGTFSEELHRTHLENKRVLHWNTSFQSYTPASRPHSQVLSLCSTPEITHAQHYRFVLLVA